MTGKDDRRLRLVDSHKACGTCDAGVFCPLTGLDKEEAQALAGIIRQVGPFAAGERIYRVGDTFRSVYSVLSGAVKSEVSTRDGRTEVTGFYLAGELLGSEAIGSAQRPADAIAIETTWLCELPFGKLEACCRNSPRLQHTLLAQLGRKINADTYQWTLKRNTRAEQRLCWFLRDLYNRLAERHGGRQNELQLPMLKEDIASYLALTPESLSRALARLEKEGVIRNRKRRIDLLDTERLERFNGQ